MNQKRTRKHVSKSTDDRTWTLTSLDQVRALADPLRLRILSVFARGPHTTKQVAESLGEKPTRLYHHVEALVRAKVIELKETRPNRGTVERYYRAVATRFTVADSLLATGANRRPASGPLSEILASILDSTRDELARSATKPTGRSKVDAPLVARGLIAGSPRQIAALRKKLTRLLESASASKQPMGGAGRPDEVTYALTIAFYPLPLET